MHGKKEVQQCVRCMSNCSRCSMVVNPRNEGKQSPKCTSFLNTRTVIGRQQHMHFFVFCRFATAAMGMPNLKSKEAGVVQYKTEKKTNQSEHNNNKKSTTAPLPTNNHFNKQPLSTNNHFQQTTTFKNQPHPTTYVFKRHCVQLQRLSQHGDFMR